MDPFLQGREPPAFGVGVSSKDNIMYMVNFFSILLLHSIIFFFFKVLILLERFHAAAILIITEYQPTLANDFSFQIDLQFSVSRTKVTLDIQ